MEHYNEMNARQFRKGMTREELARISALNYATWKSFREDYRYVHVFELRMEGCDTAFYVRTDDNKESVHPSAECIATYFAGNLTIPFKAVA